MKIVKKKIKIKPIQLTRKIRKTEQIFKICLIRTTAWNNTNETRYDEIIIYTTFWCSAVAARSHRFIIDFWCTPLHLTVLNRETGDGSAVLRRKAHGRGPKGSRAQKISQWAEGVGGRVALQRWGLRGVNICRRDPYIAKCTHRGTWQSDP